MLVVRKGAKLPDRCLKCAAPARGYGFSRSLSWHKPVWALTSLISLISCTPVYLFVRWRARVTVGLCPRHRRNRARAIALGWLAALAGLGSIIAGGMVSDSLQPIALIGGIVLLFVGMICRAVGSQVLVPRRIDKHFVWLSKVSPDYLAAFPDWSA